MSCCCFFGFGVFVTSKYIISVKENDYLTLFGNDGRTTSGSDNPGIQLSSSYKADCNSGQQGVLTLMKLAKFSVKRSDDEVGCFLVIDSSSKQICVIRISPSSGCCSRSDNSIFSNIDGTELIQMAEGWNVGQGRRQIGHVQYRLCCACDSTKIYSTTSDFHLQPVVEGQNGLRFKSSQDNREIAQVFTSLKGTNGFFPADLDLSMKIVKIAYAVGLHRRTYAN